MTLNQLEYFCAVCRYHSITRAAESLFVSQPTISASIRNLEKEFHLRVCQEFCVNRFNKQHRIAA